MTTSADTNSKPTIYTYVVGGILVLTALVTSGVPWGWASLLIVLESEGVYSDLCHNDQSSSATNIQADELIGNGNLETVCSDQVARLNLIYTIGTVTASSGSFFIGYCLDRFGERKMSIVGSILMIIACLLFGSSIIFDFSGLEVSYVLISLGCPAIFLSLMRLTRFFPGQISILLSLLNGAFDASVLVYSIFKLIHDHLHVNIGTIFIVYSLIPLSVLASTFLWPKDKPQKKSGIDISDTELNTVDEAEVSEETENNDQETACFDKSALKDMGSIPFLFTVGYNIVNILWLNFYIGTVESQLKSRFGEEEGVRLTEIFNIILPFGFFFSPIVGIILDKLSLSNSFLLLTSSLLIQAIINLTSVSFLHIINFVLYTFCRAYYYSAMASIVITEFGFEKFGKLFGFMHTLSGAPMLLQFALLSVTVHKLNNNFLFANILQICTISVFMSFPLYLWYRVRSKQGEINQNTAYSKLDT